jgi:hypothetical protein
MGLEGSGSIGTDRATTSGAGSTARPTASIGTARPTAGIGTDSTAVPGTEGGDQQAPASAAEPSATAASTSGVGVSDPATNKMLADAALLAHAFRNCLELYTGVASGAGDESTLSVLAYATSDACVAAARLSAIVDYAVPEGDLLRPMTFDVDALRRGLTNALQGIDTYYEVDMPRGNPDDPARAPEVVEASLTDDILTAAAAMKTGLAMYDAGRPAEAIWWWQYSCLSSWGERITAALHVVQTLMAQARSSVLWS